MDYIPKFLLGYFLINILVSILTLIPSIMGTYLGITSDSKKNKKTLMIIYLIISIICLLLALLFCYYEGANHCKIDVLSSLLGFGLLYGIAVIIKILILRQKNIKKSIQNIITFVVFGVQIILSILLIIFKGNTLKSRESNLKLYTGLNEPWPSTRYQKKWLLRGDDTAFNIKGKIKAFASFKQKNGTETISCFPPSIVMSFLQTRLPSSLNKARVFHFKNTKDNAEYLVLVDLYDEKQIKQQKKWLHNLEVANERDVNVDQTGTVNQTGQYVINIDFSDDEKDVDQKLTVDPRFLKYDLYQTHVGYGMAELDNKSTVDNVFETEVNNQNKTLYHKLKKDKELRPETAINFALLAWESKSSGFLKTWQILSFANKRAMFEWEPTSQLWTENKTKSVEKENTDNTDNTDNLDNELEQLEQMTSTTQTNTATETKESTDTDTENKYEGTALDKKMMQDTWGDQAPIFAGNEPITREAMKEKFPKDRRMLKEYIRETRLLTLMMVQYYKSIGKPVTLETIKNYSAGPRDFQEAIRLYLTRSYENKGHKDIEINFYAHEIDVMQWMQCKYTNAKNEKIEFWRETYLNPKQALSSWAKALNDEAFQKFVDKNS